MKQLIVSIVLGYALASSVASALADPDKSPAHIAVYGDAPYGTSPSDVSQFNATPAFIDAVNSDLDVSLVLHVGDIHSGKQFCTESYDQSIAQLWTRYDDPLVYPIKRADLSRGVHASHGPPRSA